MTTTIERFQNLQVELVRTGFATELLARPDGDKAKVSMFVDLEHGDLRLRPDSPVRKLGFQIWDISAAGLLPGHPYHRAEP